jgi:hypothetical protein
VVLEKKGTSTQGIYLGRCSISQLVLWGRGGMEAVFVRIIARWG